MDEISHHDEALFRSLLELGIDRPGTIHRELREAQDAAGRHYHTFRHVIDCLGSLRESEHLTVRPHEVRIALWFHDAVYDTRRQDNEERSAEWAETYLLDHDADVRPVKRITDMILATKRHDASTSGSRLVVDIDLAVLGGPEDDFEKYDRAIRKEYEWVPGSRYREARRRVLEGFLDRAEIYGIPEFQARYEQRARQNLRRKIDSLKT